jgi:purine-binding chemotaxis protein CheW
MVDLAKIRKKAKRDGDKNAEAAAVELATPTHGSTAPASVPEQNAPAGFVVDESSTADQRVGDVAADVKADAPQQTATTTASRKLDRFKEEAGKRRAGIMGEATAAATAVEGAQLELLTFVIAREQYAVEIETIVEIVTPRVVTRIPNSGAAIVGIISLRGTIVALMDVRRLLRQPEATSGIDSRIIVVERAGEMMGFEVDRVLRVTRVEAASVEPHPVVHASELSEAIRGVFRAGDALTILLDLDKLLDGRGVDEETAAHA